MPLTWLNLTDAVALSRWWCVHADRVPAMVEVGKGEQRIEIDFDPNKCSATH